MTVKIAVSGCRGRMGQRIMELASADERFQVAAGLEHAGHDDLGKDLDALTGLKLGGIRVTDQVGAALEAADCLIEFSSPQATVSHLDEAVRKRKAMVIGTTGLNAQQVQKVQDAASVIPIIFSPNMSVGVNILFALTERMTGAAGVARAQASEEKGTGSRIRILETHHKHKKDSPSGTAKHLGEVVKSASGGYQPDIQAFREGEVVGEHTVIWENAYEELHLIHKAKSRDAFAWGAVEAAGFAAGHQKGLYNMHHVLGLIS